MAYDLVALKHHFRNTVLGMGGVSRTQLTKTFAIKEIATRSDIPECPLAHLQKHPERAADRQHYLKLECTRR